jgi:RNA polymerase sigma factor (sigma-70 family)
MTSSVNPTLGDSDLLGAWGQQRDQGAFAALCQRHAGLVVAACRRLCAPDPDEAAQAVFIILARKPGSVADPDRLAGWLLGTARRVVANQRRAAERRQRYEQEVAVESQRRQAAAPTDWSEARPLLDEALSRLSPARREALARFYLEGKSQAVVAAELGCSIDAVKNRIHEGLDQLRTVFAKRGVALGAAVLASGLASEAAAADPVLGHACSQAALSPAGPSAALAHGVQTAMFIKSATLAACACVLTGTLVTTAFMWGAEGPPRQVSSATTTAVVCDVVASPVLEDIARQGGPRTLVFPGQPELLIPPADRERPLEGKILIERVAAYAGLQVDWSRDGSYAVLHLPAADEVIAQVRKDLNASEAPLRLAAANRAGWLSDVRVIAMLFSAAQDPDARVADRARTGLRRLGWDLVLAVTPNATPLMLADLRSPDPRIRQGAMAGLTMLPEAQALPLLEQALGDADLEVRRAACNSLGLLGGTNAFARLESLLAGPDADLQLKAMEPLARCGDGPTIARLSSRCAGLDVEQRRRMAYWFGREGGIQANRLIERMLADPEAKVRWWTMDGLGHARRRARPELIPALERELATPDPEMRRLAVWALGSVADGRGLELLEQAIQGPDDRIRGTAANALRRAGGASAMPLLERLLRHQDKAVAHGAMKALGNVGNDRACALIEQALGSEDHLMFASALMALGRVGGPRAGTLLAGCLNPPKDEQGLCLQLLGRVGNASHAALLLPALANPSSHWRRCAAEALLRIGGEQARFAVLRRLAVEPDDFCAGGMVAALQEDAHGDSDLLAQIAIAYPSAAPVAPPAPQPRGF